MSQFPPPVSRRRIIIKHVLVNVALVALLVLLGVWCYTQGKTYKLALDNSAFTGKDGLEYPALEAAEVIIDRAEPIYMMEDDSSSGKAVGKKHVMIIDKLDEDDKVLESRTIRFSISELNENLEINIAEFWLRGK